MGYTVLKINKTLENLVEVVGEFLTEEEADLFAEDGRRKDLGKEYDYIVESPPSEIKFNSGL